MWIAGNNTPIDDQVRIISLYKRDYSIAEIKRELEYDYATVKGVLNLNGYEIISATQLFNKNLLDYCNFYKEEILDFFREEKSIGRTALKFKLMDQQMSDFLNSCGVIRKELTKDQIKNIINLYESEQKTAAYIGNLYGYTAGHIINILRDNGAKIKPAGFYIKPRQFSDSELKVLIQEYLDGGTIKSLSRKYFTTITSLSKLLRGLGYDVMMSQGDKIALKLEKEIIFDYTTTKASITDLMEKYGRNYRQIKKVLKNNNIKEKSFFELVGVTFSKEELDLFIYKYEVEKIAIEDIPRITGKGSYNSIKRAFEEAGIEISNRQTARTVVPDEEAHQMASLYAQNIPIKQIAKEHKRSQSAVRKALVKSNIQIKTSLNISKRFGYVGRYKNFLFRSLMELSFIVDNERFHKIESAEQSHMIKYRFDNKIRKYYPDFILDGKIIVEIKPKQYISDRKVRRKCKTIRKYCEKNGLEFKIIEWPIDKNRIRNLFLSGAFSILNRTPEQIEDYLKIKPSHYLYEI